MKTKICSLLAGTTLLASCASIEHHTSSDSNTQVADQVIAHQRAQLMRNTDGLGFGPQSPRNIDTITGNNQRTFTTAPPFTEMNLCNIHFHKNAEHQGGEFTQYAGNGDGHGYQSGYQYSGQLTEDELSPLDKEICPSDHGSLSSGDTIEVHYVHTSAHITPGSTLAACLSTSTKNPQLRVETQVYVLVNDKKSLNFMELTQHKVTNHLHQAFNIPSNTGTPIQYTGSTTGPGYNETGSPFQVTWSVRPNIAKVNIETLGEWCKGNIFKEDHAHGVRNLVINPNLLSRMAQ
jgi:carbonic anhydrase